MKTFKQFNETKHHDFMIPSEWKKIKNYLDSKIDYENLKIEVGQSYEWDEEEYDSELDWYEAHTHFTEDDVVNQVIDEVKDRFNIINLEDKYRRKIENYISQYL